MSRFAAVAVLGFGLAALAVADDTKPVAKKSDRAPDWTGFVAAGEIQGEVVAADEDGFTLRVSWQVPARGNRARQFRPQAPNQKYQDYELAYADGSLVRWKKLPPKGTDAKGKPVQFSDKERTELRKPSSVPGYAAERGDLQPGHLVEVTLVRPKEVPADKAVTQDLRVKVATIVGTNPNGPPETKGGRKKKDP